MDISPDAYAEALDHEAEGYAARGLDDRVKQCRDEAKRGNQPQTATRTRGGNAATRTTPPKG